MEETHASYILFTQKENTEWQNAKNFGSVLL